MIICMLVYLSWHFKSESTIEPAHSMTIPTKWHVRPAKTQISLGIPYAQADLNVILLVLSCCSIFVMTHLNLLHLCPTWFSFFFGLFWDGQSILFVSFWAESSRWSESGIPPRQTAWPSLSSLCRIQTQARYQIRNGCLLPFSHDSQRYLFTRQPRCFSHSRCSTTFWTKSKFETVIYPAVCLACVRLAGWWFKLKRCIHMHNLLDHEEHELEQAAKFSGYHGNLYKYWI